MTPASAELVPPASRAGAVPAAPAAYPALLGALALHARSRPDAIAAAAIGPGGDPIDALSYCTLAARSASLATTLASTAAPGDTIILIAPSTPAFVAWFCAAITAGVRLFPVHPQSTRAELASLAQRSSARAIIAPTDLLAAADLGVPRLPFELALAAEPAPALTTPDCPAGAIILLSSGTTGLPKLVLREGPALDADAANVAAAAALTPADRVLAAMPLCHSYGVDILLATIAAGASLHTLAAFDAPALADHLARHATVFPGVPFAFEALSRLAPATPPRQFRLAFSAGAPLPLRVRDAFRAAWGRDVGQLYGATELGSVTLGDPADASFDPASVGLPMHGVSIRILDPADPARQLPRGDEGHIAVAAPSMLTGHLDADTPLADGHLLTGDLGRIDAAGRLFITGRLKLLIDVGGLKVNPLEVEAVLAAHPAVAECIVVPLPLSDTVTRLRAVYTPRTTASPPTEADLRAFLKERLSTHKIPRLFEPVPALPRSASGKVLRQMIMGAPR